MLTGFCFTTPTMNCLDVLDITEDDFCLYLREHCQLTGINTIAMDRDTKDKIPYGVIDLIHAGLRVVIVDPVYSPINDKKVLPLCVHRDMTTLSNHYHGAVCVGRLMVQMVLDHRQSHLRRITACLNHDSETPLINSLPLKEMGWELNSTQDNSVIYATR